MPEDTPPATGEFDDLTLAADATQSPRPAGDGLQKGQALGRYVVLDRLGAGGMGVVYAAFDPELDRKVAIKLLHGGPTGGTHGSSGRARLVREAQAIARISHPNVVAVHDVGTFEDSVFVAMEYIAGRTLREWLEAPRTHREIVETFVEAGRGIAAAHAAGIIHRDFKPDNVLIGDDGRIRVLDFGLARAPSELRDSEAVATEPGEPLGLSSGSIDIPLTATGAIMGTPAYMSPEQHLRGEIDARSDQFAFCVALWEALYKERPFAGETVAALAFQVAQGKLKEPPRDAGVEAALRRALERGLSLRKDDRFPTMEALLEELASDPSAVRRRWLTVAAAVGALGVVSWIGYRGGEKQATKVCAGAEERMSEVWDAGRRSAAQRSFEASELAYALDSWERVSVAIDTYVENWKASYVDACEATRLRGEQSEEMLDLRMACLEDRRRDLESITDLLIDADKDVIVRAVQLGHGLPELAPCSDRERLAKRVEAPPAEIAEQAATLEQELSQLVARYEAGKYKEVLERSGGLVDEVRRLGYRPLLAEALRLHGDVQESSGGQGLEEERESFLVALEVGNDALATRQAFSLGYVLGGNLQRFEEAEQWVRIGEALNARAGESPTKVGSAANTRAVMAAHQGKYDEARAGFERVVEIARGPEQPAHLLAAGLGNLGGFLASRGEFERAREVTQEAVDVGVAAYGPKHPSLLTWKANLGAMSVMQGDLEAGRVYLEETLALQEEVLGEGNPEMANTLGNLAIVYRRLRDEPKAEQMHRRSLAMREQALGPEHPDVADALRNLSSAVHAQGRDEEALELLERANEIALAALGPDHQDVSRGHGSIAQVLMKMDRHDEALAHAEESVAIIERTTEGEHVDLLEPLIIHGNVLIRLERWRDARPVLERAVALGEASEGDPRILADARFALAKSLHGQKREPERARSLATQAREYYESEGEHEAENAEEVAAWLAGLGD